MLGQKVPWRGVSPQASAEKSDSLRGSVHGRMKLSVVLCSLVKIKIVEVLPRLPRHNVDCDECGTSSDRSWSSCAAPVLRWLGGRIALGLLPYTRLRMISGIEERNVLPPSATSRPQAVAFPRPLFRCPFPFRKKTPAWFSAMRGCATTGRPHAYPAGPFNSENCTLVTLELHTTGHPLLSPTYPSCEHPHVRSRSQIHGSSSRRQHSERGTNRRSPRSMRRRRRYFRQLPRQDARRARLRRSRRRRQQLHFRTSKASPGHPTSPLPP